ncbi:MAG: FAD:protein FMN transferase [Clostridia bacterium]|nr:FAD:protein FMN transferase [Clostridia bacterium]
MIYNKPMKKKIAACTVALSIMITAGCAFAGCKKAESYGKRIFSMGAYATLAASKSDISQEEYDNLYERVRTFLTRTDNSISSVMSTSYIYKFNMAEAGATVEVDKTSYEILSLAKQIYVQTDGYFNPAVWYNEDLYGFLNHSAAELEGMPYMREWVGENEDRYLPLPDEKYVTAFRELSGCFGEVELNEDNGRYYAVKPGKTVTVEGDSNVYSLRIDLGGIGKGWCADKVNQMMTEEGIGYGYFSFSESSMSLKKYNGNRSGNYTLMLRDPRGVFGSPFASVSVSGENLSTSGDHLQYYYVDGVRYSHIIDPVTGSPVQTGIASVTIIGGSAAEADALTTALAAMGKQKAVEYINQNLSDCKVIMLIIENDSGKIITNCPKKIKIENSAYKITNTVEGGKIVLE